MNFKDYYETLGLQADADDKAIKAAYRKLARKYHPDVSRDADAEDKFKEVSEAYQVLKDADKRAEYDQLRRYRDSGGRTQPPPGWQQAAGAEGFHADVGGQADFSDFFENLFHERGFQQRGGRWPGRDIEVELPLFLEDTLADTRKPIRVAIPQHDERGRPVGNQERTLNVTIPAGSGEGDRIRLKGQGEAGHNGGPAGDLFLRVRLAPHPLFDVDGRDLIVTVPVAPWEVALGAGIEVPTLTGRITLTLPAGSQTGKRLRIKGKGLGGRPAGDLYAVLKVVMPSIADEQQTALWKQLAASSHFDPRADWER